MRDWSWWRFANNSRHAGSLSRLLKPQTNRTTGPPGVNEDGSRFPGKSNPLQTRLFFISIAPWSVEENDTIMSKVAKSKGKTRGKNGKTANCVEEQDNESTYSFQNYDSRWLFFIKAGTCMKRRNLVFNIIYCKFWFDGDFFVQNLDTSVELHQYQSLSQGNFFSFHDRIILLRSFLGLFFSLFYTVDFLPLLIFPWAKIFSETKNFHVWILLSERCKQNMETTWKSSPNMNGCRENSLREFAQIQDYDTFLIY